MNVCAELRVWRITADQAGAQPAEQEKERAGSIGFSADLSLSPNLD